MDSITITNALKPSQRICDLGNRTVREMERLRVGLGFVQSVVEGDACSFAVYAMEQPRLGRREVGDGEADAIAWRR